ncbi:EAL domain-containing protein [Litchfieldia salsa]
MFKKSKLAKVLFLFLILASIWQIDVAFLFSYGIFPIDTIDFFFRLLRIGSIMLTPTLFYVGYTITQQEIPMLFKSKWRYIMNRKTVIVFYGWSFIVYLVGWSKNGIASLKIIQPNEAFHFYFPTYGNLSWIFDTNVLMFVISIIACFFIGKQIKQANLRSFLLHFIFTTAVGYSIGILNMYPEAKLFPSAVAVLVFAISLLILSNRMHLNIVKEMNNELDQQRTFLRNVIDLNPNYIYAKDQEGRYSLANLSFAKLYGKEIDEIIGKTEFDIQDDKLLAKEIFQRDQTILAESKGVMIPEEVIIDKKGNIRWLQTSKIPIKTNETTVLLGVSNDITERKYHEDEITYQANHDVTTGLANRRLFNEDLTTLFKKNNSELNSAVIMLIDLDRFKYINDTLGHDVGDLLLIEVAKRLEMFLVENKLTNAKVYRVGGDEFTLVFPNCTKAESIEYATSILQEFKKGFSFGEMEYYITPSIGVSLYPEDGRDAKTLMKNADTAMYYIKEREKNNFKLFTEDMNYHFYRKMMIEKELREAVERNEFELYYQPLADIDTGLVSGMEALLRWKNKTLGVVSPAEFIPIAEETGLIIPIGEWVLKSACEQAFNWQQMGYRPLKVGVNISIRQLLDKNFLKKVATVVENSKLDPRYIDLEVTESIAMHDSDEMISKLYRLKEIGVSLSMDDFGTGYSSLSYLKKYPLDTLKIDQSFIRNITKKKDNQAIVNSIISMAKHLNLKVTAEGVENKEEYQFLSNLHCDFVQGYDISRPLNAEDFENNILVTN